MTDRPVRIYDPRVLSKIAEFYQEFTDLCEKHFPEFGEDLPVYIFGGELVLRHQDQFTIGRISWDDFPFFEITDETYGEMPCTT